jgi:3-oxoacyl-[acyl-carrier protein] reductase
MNRLKGKTAVITGSSRGIGSATANLFASEGANVVINYSRSDEQAAETLQTIQESGGIAISVKADVSKESEVRKLVEACVDKFGTIDILMNNAAILGTLKPIVEYGEDEWDIVINTNLKGTFLCIKHVLPIMLKKGKGKIINMSSISIIGDKDCAAYCASKGALATLTKALSLDFGGRGVNINAICPGAIDTEMLKKIEDEVPGTMKSATGRTPTGRLGTPEDIAYAALYLASDEADFVNGELLFVDGAIKNNIL